MRIFLQKTPDLKNPIADVASDKDGHAYEKIGEIFAKGISLLSETEPARSEEFSKLFSSIGIDPNDKGAIRTLQSLLSECAKEDLVMVRTPDTGVFHIRRKIENEQTFRNVAVFKIGAKRAAMEILMRRFSWLLGLEKQMVPCMYCAASDPDIKYGNREEDTVEELWNGNVKRFMNSLFPERSSSFSSTEEDSLDEEEIPDCFSAYSVKKIENTSSVVIGVVQPFLYPKESKDDLSEFILMSILACAIGLRDGKKDGYIHNTWIDVEDCMPMRIDPEISKEGMQKTASAFDLPYLDEDKRADIKLSLEKIHSIAKTVKNWNIPEIIKTLSEQKILFYDPIAENMKLKQRGFDDGNCPVKIEEPKSHAINGHLKIDLSTHSQILTPMQLDACGKRLERLKDYILKCSSEGHQFSAKNLVFSVDKHLHAYYKTVMSPSISKSTLFGPFDRCGVFSLLGRVSPIKMGLKISKKKIAKEWLKILNGGTPSLFSKECYSSPPPDFGKSSLSEKPHPDTDRDPSPRKKEGSCRDSYRLSPSGSESFFQNDEDKRVFS